MFSSWFDHKFEFLAIISKQDEIIVQKLKEKKKLAQEELLEKTKNKKEKTKTCGEQCVFSYLI